MNAKVSMVHGVAPSSTLAWKLSLQTVRVNCDHNPKLKNFWLQGLIVEVGPRRTVDLGGSFAGGCTNFGRRGENFGVVLGVELEPGNKEPWKQLFWFRLMLGMGRGRF